MDWGSKGYGWYHTCGNNLLRVVRRRQGCQLLSKVPSKCGLRKFFASSLISCLHLLLTQLSCFFNTLWSSDNRYLRHFGHVQLTLCKTLHQLPMWVRLYRTHAVGFVQVSHRLARIQNGAAILCKALNPQQAKFRTAQVISM
jgi:hypothetical protein